MPAMFSSPYAARKLQTPMRLCPRTGIIGLTSNLFARLPCSRRTASWAPGGRGLFAHHTTVFGGIHRAVYMRSNSAQSQRLCPVGLGGRTTGAEMPLARKSHIICSEFFGRTLSEPGACWRTLLEPITPLPRRRKKSELMLG